MGMSGNFDRKTWLVVSGDGTTPPFAMVVGVVVVVVVVVVVIKPLHKKEKGDFCRFFKLLLYPYTIL